MNTFCSYFANICTLVAMCNAIDSIAFTYYLDLLQIDSICTGKKAVRRYGLVENAGTRICGYAGMRICGYAGMRICGYADMRVCGYVELV